MCFVQALPCTWMSSYPFICLWPSQQKPTSLTAPSATPLDHVGGQVMLSVGSSLPMTEPGKGTRTSVALFQ
jgi:hypothetical protein